MNHAKTLGVAGAIVLLSLLALLIWTSESGSPTAARAPAANPRRDQTIAPPSATSRAIPVLAAGEPAPGAAAPIAAGDNGKRIQDAISAERANAYNVLVSSGKTSATWARDARKVGDGWIASLRSADTAVDASPGECYAAGCFWELRLPADYEAVVSRLDGFSDWPTWIRLGIETDGTPPRLSFILFNPDEPLPI